MVFFFLVAQDGNAITGGAGWVGAGLLGLVLSWLLMVRMPAWDKLMDTKDKQIQTLIETRDKLFEKIADGHSKQLEAITVACDERMQLMAKNHDEAFALAEKDRRTDFQATLERIVTHCQRESDLMKKMLERDLAESNAAVIDLRRVMEELREQFVIKRHEAEGK